MKIEVRVQGKSKKYYLAHSFRKSGKPRKMRFYLGVNLDKAALDEKVAAARKVLEARLEAAASIGDPLKTVLSRGEIEEVSRLERKFDLRVYHLGEDGWKAFTKMFAYDTNAIEGSTITLRDVDEILEGSRWPENREKWEISETYGVAEAVRHIRAAKEHVSVGLIKDLHRIVFRNSKRFAGKLRPHGVEVAVVDSSGRVVHRGAPSRKVPGMLRDLESWYRRNRSRYPPLVLAAVVHNYFEVVHPFQDGNGRVGRLLMNNILIKNGLPPVNIEMKNRAAYYAALRRYQENGDIRPTIELLLMEYRSNRKKLGLR